MLSFPSTWSHSLCTLNFCNVGCKNLMRPFQGTMLVLFWSKRKGELWKNPYGVPFSFSKSQSGLLSHLLSLPHPCVGQPSLLSPGFSLNSQSPLPEGPSCPVSYKSSFYSSTLLPSSSFCCWLLILQSSSWRCSDLGLTQPWATCFELGVGLLKDRSKGEPQL